MLKILIAAMISLSIITACGQKNEETPTPSPAVTNDANNMADDMGDAMDDMEDGVGDAMNGAGDAVKDAGDAVKNMSNGK